MHRSQIPIEPLQPTYIKRVATRQDQSISEVIREIVTQYLVAQREGALWVECNLVLDKERELRRAMREANGSNP